MMKKTIFLLLMLAMMVSCKKSENIHTGQDNPVTINEKGNNPQSENGKTNHPPAITAVDVTPLYAKVGDTLKIDATASDADGDTIKFIFRWFKNDIPLTEESNSLALSNDFKRGDRIAIDVIPDDGIASGNAGKITLTIGNSSPEIISSASDNKFGSKVFSYQVRAIDKDNDQLLYSLKNAPAGMTINQNTGSVQWNVPSEFSGRASVTVSVSDGQSGEAVQSFAFDINP